MADDKLSAAVSLFQSMGIVGNRGGSDIREGDNILERWQALSGLLE
jgi:hypothetical protein